MNYPNKNFIESQQFNGTYKISELGLKTALKIVIGTRLLLVDSINNPDSKEVIVSDIVNHLPTHFWFKCENFGGRTFGIENVDKIIKL